MKSKLRLINWILVTQYGLDVRKAIKGLLLSPRYMSDLIFFRNNFSGEIVVKPCLHDRTDEAGRTKSDYFLQDLIVAREIYEVNPIKHVDIGSRIDGFVAHVASYRECEVFDIRSISTSIPGIKFMQADLMSDQLTKVYGEHEYCDSLSCLHAIEHFGLGRYGDSLSVNGFEYGLSNISKLIAPGGTMYLSTPVGRERVEFNANWIFNPHRIVNYCESLGLTVKKILTLDGSGVITEVAPSKESYDILSAREYTLGIFIFKKLVMSK